MDRSATFEDAQARVKKLTKSPSTEDLLELHALYKQATVGDVSGARPGTLDMKGRAKYDAWAKMNGMASSAAMRSYVAFVAKLGG